MDFKTLDKKYREKKWELNKISIWPSIRIQMHTKLMDAKYLRQTNFFESGLTSKIKKILEIFKEYFCLFIGILKDRKHNRKFKNLNIDAVFLNNTGCRRYVHNCWKDVFCDPIRDELKKKGYSSASLEWNNSKYHFPRNKDSCFISLYVDWIKFKVKFLKKNYDFDLECFEEMNRDLDYAFNLDSIKYSAKLILEFKKFFLKKLNGKKLKFAFTSIYYNEIGMGFILACKEMNVMTIDIQHGIQGGDHPAYNWQNDSNYEVLPDVFLVWRDEEADNVKKWNNRCVPVVSGNRWLEEWLEGENDIVKYYDDLIIKLKKEYQICILYSLGYEEIPEWVIEVMKQTEKKFVWLVRLHPGDVGSINKRMNRLKGCNNCIINESTVYPLHALLRNVDVHLTEYSSVIIESRQFGVASVSIRNDVDIYYRKEIENDLLIKSLDEEELLKAIYTQAKKTKILKENDRGAKRKNNFIEKLEEIYRKKVGFCEENMDG